MAQRERRGVRIQLRGVMIAISIATASIGWLGAPTSLRAQDGARVDRDSLDAIKQRDAREQMRRLEEAMARIAEQLKATEPYNAAKLQRAFLESRERLLIDGMDRVLRYLDEKKLDRALESQEEVAIDLDEVLRILLQEDIDPRELLREIKRLKGLLGDVDRVIQDETRAKLRSDDAEVAGASSKALRSERETLRDLIERQKGVERATRGDDAAKSIAARRAGNLAGEQTGIQRETETLRDRDAAREANRAEEVERNATARPPSRPGEPGQPGEQAPPRKPGQPGEQAPPGESGQPGTPGESGPPGEPGQSGESGPPGESEASPGEPEPAVSPPDGEAGKPGAGGDPDEARPPPGDGGLTRKLPRPEPAPESVLDRDALDRAARAMKRAAKAIADGDPAAAQAGAAEARKALEEADGASGDQLDRLRARREFSRLKNEQDEIKKDTDSLAEKMRKPLPLIGSEEGVPGRKDVESAAQNMGQASGQLGRGEAGEASSRQRESLDSLQNARAKMEESLERLQEALRERLLAYLKEKFTRMLEEQKKISAGTKTLHLKSQARELVRAEDVTESERERFEAMARRDRLVAESLAERESELALIAEDVVDLLQQDGTTLVFPEIVEEIRSDLNEVSGALSRIDVGQRTQYVQSQIEASIEDILASLERAQKEPPPPNPNSGRESQSGAAPLLPKSAELKMVRALQKRVNERTREFDRSRPEELGPEEKLRVDSLAKKQRQVRDLLRKVARSVGQ